MRAGFPRHDFRASHRYAQRHAGRNAFRDRYDVRMKIEMLECEHLPATAHTALDFIRDEENPADLVKRLTRPLASGSYLTIAHGTIMKLV